MREATTRGPGCSLGEAKTAVEDLPREILVEVSEEHARRVADVLGRAGCDAEVVLPARR